jgi:hypothetical protein
MSPLRHLLFREPWIHYEHDSIDCEGGLSNVRAHDYFAAWRVGNGVRSTLCGGVRKERARDTRKYKVEVDDVLYSASTTK